MVTFARDIRPGHAPFNDINVALIARAGVQVSSPRLRLYLDVVDCCGLKRPGRCSFTSEM